MLGTLWLLVWSGTALLALVAVVRYRRRLGAHRDRRLVLDDDDVLRIIAYGVFVSEEDEPLDLDQVQEEERRFWEEAEAEWDEAEEW